MNLRLAAGPILLAASAIGVPLVVADANGGGRPDVVSANKRGTFVIVSGDTAGRK